MPMRREEIGQFRAELPGGKIRDPARAVQRFVSWACGYEANHGLKLMETDGKARWIFTIIVVRIVLVVALET